MQDGDLLARVVLGDPRRDESALRVVAAVEAHDGRMALFRQRRVRRRRAHHQHVVVGVDVRRRDRRARAGVAGDELDLLADDEIGDRDRLLGIAGVVLDDDLDLAPVDAAGLVDRGGGGLAAAFHLFADRGDRAGHRTDDGDLDVLSLDRRRINANASPVNKGSALYSCSTPSYFLAVAGMFSGSPRPMQHPFLSSSESPTAFARRPDVLRLHVERPLGCALAP